MQIILLERVAGLGNLGDVVTVKNGYARNFLIPTAKAKRACASAKIAACFASNSARRASNSFKFASVSRLALAVGIKKLRA